MKTTPLTFFALTAGLLMLSAPMFAHHGVAAYDMTKLTTVKGTVTDFQFINPHVEIYFNVVVEGEKGKVEQWIAEANSPNVLARAGWNKNVVKPGDQITAIGYRAKNGSTTMRLHKIVLPNGQELTLERGSDYSD
jgi:hypothetical protein